MARPLDEKTVLLQDVPAPVVAALTEHLAGRAGLVMTSLPTGRQPDLILCAETVDDLPPAVPILRLLPPDRLGHLLADIARALDEPALAVAPFLIGSALFNPAAKTLTPPDMDDVVLTERETALLLHLARHAPTPVARDELLRAVWQYHEGIDTHTLETHIYRLRQKMTPADADAAAGAALKTVDEGYVLMGVAPVRE